MPSLETAFTSLKPTLLALETRVRSSLSAYISSNQFLLSYRIKEFDSVQDKLETGRYKKLNDLDDLVAFTIIIDTRDQVPEVVRYLKANFDVVTVRGASSIYDEKQFSFDATRVYLRLLPTSLPGPINNIIFEVQVRTLLQHAWSKITHSLVYKSSQVDPKKIRLASEILAALEGADRHFSRFATSAKGVKLIRNRATTRINEVVDMIDKLILDGVIPTDMRPKNARRVAENILNLIDRKADNEKAIECVRMFYESLSPSFPRSISLTQLAIVALNKGKMLRENSSRKQNYYFISPELISMFPEGAEISPAVQIDLS